jgi:aldose 1-epimerase
MNGLVTQAPFGTTPGGEPVEIFTIRNASGVTIRATSFGACIVSLVVPDRAGRLADVVLGFDSLVGYLNDTRYLGAIVGRYAGRIAHARFTLDGTTYRLAATDGPHHAHGGRRGFDKVVWRATPSADGAGVEFRHTSPDGEEGYPGTLHARVTYGLTERNELAVDYEVTTDKASPVNLTQHSYFNLAGAGTGDINGHVLQLHANLMAPLDPTMIPTGELVSVAGTPFDFRVPTAIGARIEGDNEQLRRAGGYDHTFLVNRGGPGLVHAARVIEPGSGRTLDVHTTEPGIQLYTGNFLSRGLTGKGGRAYPRRAGFCLETQHFPDSPNQPAFPSAIVRPGTPYRSRTVFAFSVTA